MEGSPSQIVQAIGANPNVPQARCAAWINYLDFFACFLDHPNVKYYTIRHRKHQLPFLGWTFFQEKYTHPLIAHLGIPGYTGDLVGHQAGVQLHIDGGPKVDAPAYLNIESDGAWLFTHRDRKGIITSWLYAAAPGEVETTQLLFLFRRCAVPTKMSANTAALPAVRLSLDGVLVAAWQCRRF